ncbi:helix-turn-helix transcriptional regulator [Streptomyces tsukubensis]
MKPDTQPGTKSERNALRHEMAEAGRSLTEIAIEMRVRFRMRPREAWRHAHGWTLQEAADRISSLQSPAIAADASLVGKWEKWPGPSSRRPSLAVLTAMAAVMNCSIEDLLDYDDYRSLPHNDLRVLRHQGEPPEAVPAVATSSPVDTSTNADQVLSAARESAMWAQWAETTNVGGIALEQVHADIQALSCDYLTGDAVELFVRTRTLRDRVFALIEGHQAPRQSIDLYVSAGYLCTLMAWISSDLGNLRAADTQGRTAWLCAEMAGHSELRAWVASTRSKVAFWDGRLKDAISHARRGTSCRPQGTVGVLLQCQEADAWSKLGVDSEVEDALNRAEALRESLTGTDEVGGLFSCPSARQENYAAGAHLRVGSFNDSLMEANRALEHLRAQSSRPYGTEAQIHISRAAALVGAGHPEGVMDALGPVLALPLGQRLMTITQRMEDFGSYVAGHRSGTGSVSVVVQQTLVEWCADSVRRRQALSSGDASV